MQVRLLPWYNGHISNQLSNKHDTQIRIKIINIFNIQVNIMEDYYGGYYGGFEKRKIE